MKSICSGDFISRIRSAKNITLPFKMHTTTGVLPSYSLSSCAASAFTRSEICSGVIMILSMFSFRSFVFSVFIAIPLLS